MSSPILSIIPLAECPGKRIARVAGYDTGRFLVFDDGSAVALSAYILCEGDARIQDMTPEELARNLPAGQLRDEIQASVNETARERAKRTIADLQRAWGL